MDSRPRFPELGRSLSKAQEALRFAEHAHAGQVRKVDGTPFIVHPFEVASLLSEAGAADHVVAAGALHDTIEKTTVRAVDLRQAFGQPVTRLVLAVTEDEGITDYHERKLALREQVSAAGPEAMLVFAADKVSKARELHLEWYLARRSNPAVLWQPPERRMGHYRECLRLFEDHAFESPLVAQLRTEIETLPGSVTYESLLAGV